MVTTKVPRTPITDVIPGMHVKHPSGVVDRVVRVADEGGMVAVTFASAPIAVLFARDATVRLVTLPYRIEERTWLSGRPGAPVDVDQRERALAVWEELVEKGARLGLYGPYGGYRLVLLGPDRTKLPPSVVNGPAL